jgi:2',3'-cyclic-nucleotide 2'-phosphodiesterase (5'-nucleotidase family)
MKTYLLIWMFALGLLCSCQASYNHISPAVVYYQPGKDTLRVADSALLEIISPYRAKMDLVMNEILAYSRTSMEKGLPESALGNLVADACFSVAKNIAATSGIAAPDFCVLNNGGLRSSLPSGNITRKNIFELMPFENELVIVSLPGPAVYELLEYISLKGGVPVSNLKMILQPEQLQHATIGNTEFDSSVTYRVLTSDYLANGGDAMSVFGKNTSVDHMQTKVRDAIIEHLQQMQKNFDTINPVIDGRLAK